MNDTQLNYILTHVKASGIAQAMLAGKPVEAKAAVDLWNEIRALGKEYADAWADTLRNIGAAHITDDPAVDQYLMDYADELGHGEVLTQEDLEARRSLVYNVQEAATEARDAAADMVDRAVSWILPSALTLAIVGGLAGIVLGGALAAVLVTGKLPGKVQS